jgi:hypothetical protein
MRPFAPQAGTANVLGQATNREPDARKERGIPPQDENPGLPGDRAGQSPPLPAFIGHADQLGAESFLILRIDVAQLGAKWHTFPGRRWLATPYKQGSRPLSGHAEFAQNQPQKLPLCAKSEHSFMTM